MDTKIILYIILVGIIALLLALFQYWYKSKKFSKISVVLTILRFTTLFGIFLLLVNPKFEKRTYFDEKPTLVIAVDNSESMDYLEPQHKTTSLVELLKNDKSLNSKFDISFYSFGKELKDLDRLSFDEKQTNPSLVFDQFSQVYANVVAPLVLITDGNQTFGNDYEYVAKAYKQIIFPVVVGDTKVYTDVKIDHLNVNRYAFLNNKFPVEIIATYNGTDKANSQLTITSGKAVVFSKDVSFTAQENSQIISITLPANSSGVHSYKAELKPLDVEKNKLNNIKNFAVEVIDRKTKVAIISDIIHPDLGALKKAIESTEQSEAVILKPEDFIKNNIDFQQVIIYQPNAKFKNVYDLIKSLSLNTFTILGPETNFNAFNKLQQDVVQNITNQEENYQAILNPNYNVFLIDDLNFEKFPPLHSEFGATDYSVQPEVILFKAINGIKLKEPLMLGYESNQQRAVILNGSGLWRWRAQSFLNEQSFKNFDNFIGKIIQYLDSKQQRNLLNIDYQSFYDGNDNVVINAQVFTKTYEFDSNAIIEIVLQNKERKEIQTLPFVLKNNNYQLDLSGLSAGDYDFTIKVQNKTLERKGTFKILDYNVEQQFSSANVSKLKTIATASEGSYYFIDDTKNLMKNLIADERFVTIQKSTKNNVSLIDLKILLALIVLSLSAEWFIRKYFGLI